MMCPNCNSLLIVDGECQSCGIYVDKYLPKESRKSNRSDVNDNKRHTRLFFGSFSLLLQKVYLFADKKHRLDIENRIKDGKNYCYKAYRDIKNSIFKLSIHLIVAYTLVLFFSYFIKIMWELYLFTPVGVGFMKLFPERYLVISTILSGNLEVLSYRICLISLQYCLFAAAFSRLSFIMRIFYEGRSFLTKYVTWPAICAVIGLAHTVHFNGLQIMQLFFILFIPSIIISAPCFDLASRVLPELNIVKAYKLTIKSIVKNRNREEILSENFDL